MKKKLYLHIGPHKTGSTYIQKRFFDDQEEIKSFGYAYPATCLEPLWGHHKLVEAFQRGDTQELGDIKADFAKYSENLIISSENFDRLDEQQIESVRTLFSNYDIHIIYVKRRADDLIVSSWQESIKHGGMQSWQSYIFQHTVRPFSSEVINACRVLDRFKAVFGRDSISIIDFDGVKRENRDLFIEFKNLIGLKEWEKPVSKSQVNRSMPYWKAEIIRGLNALFCAEGQAASAKIRTAFLDYFSERQDTCNSLATLKKKISAQCSPISFLDSYIFHALDKSFRERYQDRVCVPPFVEHRHSLNQYKLPNDTWMFDSESMEHLKLIKSRLSIG
ncbi:hypothetical protein [Idiomarina sp.]|uniref:hypothetical protein n=1 Tax=Idiomarina sp. TaxID=1874361 RepID=UPI0025C6557C|nr:hypothetical protein [Idiomarina sp.]NQZ04538.1 hypothetical protein [Idiomarina sp.]